MKRKNYEVAPGLYVGSEIGDINREIKTLVRKFLNENNREYLEKITALSRRKEQLLLPKNMRK
jgi:hypothetical protein